MDKSGMVKSHLAAATAGLPATPLVGGVAEDAPLTPVPSDQAKLSDELSPMHPARATARPEEDATEITDGVEGPSKLVDVIFSPMLKLLGGEDEEEGATEEVLPEDESKSNEKAVGPEDEVEENEDVVVDMPQDDQEDAVIVEADEGSSQGTDVTEEEEFNPYAFIKSLPPYDDVKSFCPTDRLPAKDEDSPPISLVLDLDETLVHCTVEAVDDADLTFPVEFHGMTYQVYVRLRPHLNEFLEAIADKFEVIVFTASQQVYADALLDLIDPENKYIKHRMFRESCLSVEGNFLKDLNVLGRDLKKSVLVDNSPHAFGYQVNNGIPIESWFDDRSDTELLKLERFLRTLHGVEDVREKVKGTFQTYRLIDDAPYMR